MKLRNIFLAGLAVCTMAGCSKDETTDYSQMGEVDAYVSFGVTAALQTKSTVGEGGNEIEKEAKVQKLTALIFKGTDDNATFVTSETETVEGNETIRDIKHLVVKVMHWLYAVRLLLNGNLPVTKSRHRGENSLTLKTYCRNIRVLSWSATTGKT